MPLLNPLLVLHKSPTGRDPPPIVCLPSSPVTLPPTPSWAGRLDSGLEPIIALYCIHIYNFDKKNGKATQNATTTPWARYPHSTAPSPLPAPPTLFPLLSFTTSTSISPPLLLMWILWCWPSSNIFVHGRPHPLPPLFGLFGSGVMSRFPASHYCCIWRTGLDGIGAWD